jgi:hypothetical protein
MTSFSGGCSFFSPTVSSMSYIYGLVCYDRTPLAEFSRASSGNYRSIARDIVSTLKFDGSRVALDQDAFVFSAFSESTKLSVVVLSDKGLEAKNRFYVVEQIRNKFISKYLSSYSSLGEFSKSKEFAPEIERIFKECQSPTAAKIAAINANLEATQNIMTQNLSAALARSEKLEVMQEKAESIRSSAKAFERESTDIRKAMWCQRYKWYFIGAGIAVAVIAIIVVIAVTA